VAERGRRLLRLGVLVAGLVWYVHAMLWGTGPRGIGFSGADLALTIGVLGSIAALPVGMLLYRRHLPYAAVALSVGAAAGVMSYAAAPERPATAVLFLICGLAAARYPLHLSLPVLAVAAAGTSGAALIEHRPAGELWVVVGLLGLFTGVRSGRLRVSARQAEERTLILAERAHLAREIHDILAHSLSAQLVHLEGARLLIAGGRTDEALDRVERARGLARSGLEETRRAVATLRGDTPPLDDALRELAAEHRTLTDARCEVTVTGEPADPPAKAGLAVIRTAQEALTNVRKHAPGADVAIGVRYAGGWCELEVTDSGGADRPAPLAGSGGGYGLVGMRERAELIGGTLDAAPMEKGFRVLLRVPL
jgi:signal transduction histidine kinase